MLTDLLDLPMPRAKVPARFTVHFDRAGQPILYAHLRVASLLDPDDEDLPDGLSRDAGGNREAEWCGTQAEFETDDIYYRVCGGSPMCLP